MKIGKIYLFALFLFLISCKNDTLPRPHGYFRISMPKRHLVSLPDTLPYQFKIPDFVVIKPDKNQMVQASWINLNYPAYKATIHISYYPVHNNLVQLLDDTHTLAYKHSVKADAIDESVIIKPARKVYGMFYAIEGNAASQLQFFLTDSTKNYFRAALYFNVEPNPDSLKPVINYIHQDMKKIIETFEWKPAYKE